MRKTGPLLASVLAPTSALKSGLTAVFSVFGVAWMADTFFAAHNPGRDLGVHLLRGGLNAGAGAAVALAQQARD